MLSGLWDSPYIGTDGIEDNVTIYPNAIICKGAKIGEWTTIGHNVFIGENVSIGQGCRIQGNVYIPEGVVIGKHVFIGPGVIFTNVKKPIAFIKSEYQKTIVGNKCVIGAGAIILPGIELGFSCFIGAGSVVTRPVRIGVTVYGNPAREHAISKS